MKVRYLTCQICGRELKVRLDGKFPRHRITRIYKPKKPGPLLVCPGSDCYP
jgi:hypothetical protein